MITRKCSFSKCFFCAFLYIITFIMHIVTSHSTIETMQLGYVMLVVKLILVHFVERFFLRKQSKLKSMMKSKINNIRLLYVNQLKIFLEFVLIYSHHILFQFACIVKQIVMIAQLVTQPKSILTTIPFNCKFASFHIGYKTGVIKHHFCFDVPNFFVISLNWEHRHTHVPTKN